MHENGSTQPSNIRILLVDDDTAILEGVEDLLTIYGYSVTTAMDGYEGLERMAAQPFDLVISDIMMPEMDGYAFFDQVRSHPEWTTIPFIFLTARGQKKDIREGQRMGVDAYLTKPFEPEDLLVLVESRIQRIKAIQQVVQDDLDHIKNQLITVFSHELRTPLTYIYGYVNLLQDQFTDLSNVEVDEMMDGIRRGAERLVKLVEDLMLAVRLDSGVVAVEVEMRSKPFSLHEAVNSAVSANQAFAEQRGVVVRIDVPQGVEVMVVPTYFIDALERLINNAVKFSKPTQGRVDIEADFDEDGMAAILIRDNGGGFDPEKVEVAFDRLSQLNRQQLEQQGIGLGLAISREMMRLHGGDVTGEALNGSGSLFTVTVPVVESILED